jgi:uncharacterized delta-60 repeat protein
MCSPPTFEHLEQRRLLTSGQLDPFFGSGGLVRLQFPLAGFTAVRDLQPLPNGQILAAVEIQHPIPNQTNATYLTTALVRLNRNGSIDRTFGGGDGVVDTNLRTDRSNDILVQPDGMILLSTGRMLARFKANGSPDRSFATNGRLMMNASAAGLTLQPNGKILVGAARQGILYAQRFNADGTPDNSFSADSIATVPGAGRGVAFSGIALIPNGTIYLGSTRVVVPMGENTEDAVYAYDIAHLRTDGTLDTAYGASGTGIVEKTMGVYIGMHGQLLVEPSTERALFTVFSDLNHMIFAYDRHGTTDTTYGNAGKFDARLTHNMVIDAASVFMQHDGAVIAGGSAWIGTAPGGPGPDQNVQNPALARTTPVGTADTGFGDEGRAVAQLPGQIPPSNDRYTHAEAMTSNLDGSILVAARDRDGTFTLMRFWRDDAPAAELAAPLVRAPRPTQVLTVTYRADTAVNDSSLDNRDVRVSGPNGYFAYGRLIDVDATDHGRVLTARYALSAAGGVWDEADNGFYIVRLRDHQVSDTAGHFSESRIIGRFEIRIR